MLELKVKPNMTIKNKLFSEFSSDYFIKLNKNELSPKKQNYSYSQDIENKKFITISNEFDLLSSGINSINNNIIEDNNIKNNPLEIYEEIKSLIEKFINENNNEKNIINFFLKEILNAIIIVIEDINNSKFEIDINYKIIFLLKIQKLNDRIKIMNEELEFYKNIININKKFKYGINMISILKKKIMEQKEKSQKEEFKYLLCIEEQEKKINTLENELKKKKHENLPIDTIKSIRCFPYFHQYNFKEDINPKSIPMFQQFKYDAIKKPSKSLSNSNTNKLKNNKSSKYRNLLCLTNLELDKIKANMKITSFIPKRNKVMNLDIIKANTLNNYNNQNINDNMTLNNSPLKNKTIDNELNGKNKIIKDFHPKTILDNKKEFFVAHPTLNTAGIIKKKEQKYIGIPNKLLRLKLHKSLEKNMQIKFPSSLNETLVNLEKLRKYKNN
jgi:hypothetical protein